MTEADDLRSRIEAGEAALAAEQAAWDAQWLPIDERRTRALLTLTSKACQKELAICSLDIRNLGPRPDESIGLGMLKGRLHRLTEEGQAA